MHHHPTNRKQYTLSITLGLLCGAAAVNVLTALFVNQPARAQTSAPDPAASRAALVIYDPHGEAIARVTARHFPYESLQSLANLRTLALDASNPSQTRIVLIGRDALTDDEAKSPDWATLVASGVRLIVLEQRFPSRPLRKPAVPVDTWLVEFSSPCTLTDAASPILAGVDPKDFTSLSQPKDGDFVPLYGVLRQKNVPDFDPNGRERYTKRLVGDEVLSLGANKEAPIYTPLLVYPHGKGAAALCQLPVASNLANDPTAQRIFDNLLTWASQPPPSAPPP